MLSSTGCHKLTGRRKKSWKRNFNKNSNADSSGADSTGHGGTCPHFYKWLGTGEHRDLKNSKQETDQTLLTITKALINTTSCTSRAKKVEGHDEKNSFRCFVPDRCPSPSLPPPPTYKCVPASLGASV